MSAYITSTGRHLPGPPVTNDEIEDLLGHVNGESSRSKWRILKSNGIQTRHYAINAEHETTISNSGMAAAAARECLAESGLSPGSISLLSCATSQGDLVLPGFGSMVQAELQLPAVELHTSHGICSSGMMALRLASMAVQSGEHRRALVVSSELASRLFKASRYEAVGAEKLDFNAEFLRWMLSDGAGAMLLEDKPVASSLRIDWLRGWSHADAFPVCMSIGSPSDAADSKTWQDFPTYGAAEAAGALLIRQDVRLLENIVKVGVEGFLRLIREGLVRPDEIDYVLCHYSSDYFRGRIFALLELAGVAIPEEKWYTNLTTRGNTGCASMFIMLDEFRRTHELGAGQRILCMVPESGRFNTTYMQLTVVDP